MNSHKNASETLPLNLTQTDRPLPESWRRAALDVLRTKVRPAFRPLKEGQSVRVACERRKSPELHVKRLSGNSLPWLARVQLNAETVMFVAQNGLRLIHCGETYFASF